jgi:histone arginine demethylase JMJD6
VCPQKLRKNYKRVMLKCGEDDDGKSVRVKFKYFMKYLKLQTDDSPLYIFDSTFDDHKDTKPLLADYKVPKYFPEDLFELVGEDRRPPYRWFLVGPKRSGTTLHLDPLGSSAWNTLIVGRKRWVLFPPHVPKSVVNGKKHVQRGEDDEAVNYFMDLLPRVKRANSPEALGCIEFMQYPGETVFVPGGWWHAVLNVEDTVAVTQNFCSSQNFPGVWRKTRTGRKKMAVKWLHKLDGVRPDLGKVARELNAKDQFVMPPSDKQEKQDKHSERKDDNKKKKTSEGKHKRKKDESAEPSATKKKAKRN